MTPHSIFPVILAGGSGTRLWPLSRALYPKQFLAFGGDRTLFQQAVLRLSALPSSGGVAAPCIVSQEEHRFMVMDQMRETGITPSAIVLEPEARNTAPALTLAALHAVDANPGVDPLLVITPADHAVTNVEAFHAALSDAVDAAAQGAIVLLGIVPDRAETGFGYFQAGTAAGISAVASFLEKPDAATADRYLEEGGYWWNSGIFVLRASLWLKALERCNAGMLRATESAWAARKVDGVFIRPGKEAFGRISANSIDVAVMEQAPRLGLDLRMVPLNAGWSDVGTWEAVWQLSERNAQGNATCGDVLIEGSRDTLVHASSRLVTAVGLQNVVVVETPDAVLVADRSHSQGIRQIVATLKQAGRSEETEHRRVHRPWGWYESLDRGPGFQVKRITVKPGASLSLQLHNQRAEHWIVLSGTAEVTRGDQVTVLEQNESTFIAIGQKHRLANRTDQPLEVIEVQSGSYLGEDDIVRLQQDTR